MSENKKEHTEHSSNAQYSNAGHEYHKLWVVRTLLSMLSPMSKLRCVKVEGVNANDSANILTKYKFLAVDMAEYYGGTDLNTAEKVIVSQVKYSTTNKEGLLDISALTKRSSKTLRNSVIQRLADTYMDFVANGFAKEEILRKVSIRLISNRSLDPKLVHSINLLKKMSQAGSVIDFTEFITMIPLKESQAKRHLTKLYRLLELKDLDFFDFFELLDLNGCNAGSRSWQQLAILNQLTDSVAFSEQRHAMLELRELVNSHMLPENSNASGIELEDVLAALSVSEYQNLFPEEPKFSMPENLIKNLKASDLAKVIWENARLLAHGSAGVGKSTTLQQVCEYLPAGSVTIMYDCFGAGNYRSVNSGRHTLSHALMQLSNEISAHTGIPFLTTPPAGDKYALIKMFQQRLSRAAELIGENNGLLVLIIDAADNAVQSTSLKAEPDSFVSHLWALDLPANCRLVMSARSGARTEKLMAPANTFTYELTGFDLDGSSRNLKRIFPNASPRSCKAFHEKTRANPRIQTYLIDKAAEYLNPGSAFRYVFKHAHKLPENIFEDIIQQAVKDAQNPDKAQEQLAMITCLHRPIPLDVFAQVCDLRMEQARDFCQSLSPGILFTDDVIEIRDEDFDTHLNIRTEIRSSVKQAHSKLADHFKKLVTTSQYAAKSIADHFWEAECYEDLINLALNELSAEIVTDRLTRISTEERRLKLALRAAAHLNRDKEGAQLLLLACELRHANEESRKLVRSNLVLANTFGNANNLESYFESKNSGTWQGSMHFKLASVYSMYQDQSYLANHHLNLGNAWIRKYMRVRVENNWHVSKEDIANQTVAIFWLKGFDAARDSLSRWRPTKVAISSLVIAARKIIPYIENALVETYLTDDALPLRARCMILGILWAKRQSPSLEVIIKISNELAASIDARNIRRKNNGSYGGSGYDWAIPIAELFTYKGIDPTLVSKVLVELSPSIANNLPSKHESLDKYIYPWRGFALKRALAGQSLKINDILPKKLERTEDKKNRRDQPDVFAQDRYDFEETFAPIIKIYNLHAQILLGSIDDSKLLPQISKMVASMRTLNVNNIQWYVYCQEALLFGAVRTLSYLDGQREALALLFDNAVRVIGRRRARLFWRKMGSLLVFTKAYRQVGQNWIEHAANDIMDDSVNIQDRWEFLLACAEATFSDEDEMSRDLYQRAIKAADEGISDEVTYRLKAGASMIREFSQSTPSLRKKVLATRLAALTEAYSAFNSGETEAPAAMAMLATAGVNSMGALALLARWDKSNLLAVEDGVGHFLMGATRGRQWPVSISVPFLRIQGEQANLSDLGVELLDCANKSVACTNQSPNELKIIETFESLATWATHDAPLRHRTGAIKQLQSWASSNKLSSSKITDTLNNAMSFINKLEQKSTRSQSADDNFQRGHNLANLGDLASFRGDHTIQLGLDISSLHSCLVVLGRNTRYSQRTEFLDLICDLRLYQDYEEQVKFGYLPINLLKLFLGEWKNSQAVNDWIQGNALNRFFLKNIDQIINQGDWPCHLKAYLELYNPTTDRSSILLPAVVICCPL